MSRSAPLFRFDPGWLFTLAGLALMVASALLPAERDLHDLRQQLAALEVREAWNEQRLAAYGRFMHDLSERDPALVRRLAASQLNLMPEGEQPLLMATSIEHTVSDWIEATVASPEFFPTPPADTLLTRLADGPRRLWLMGGGAFAVFVGLVMGFSVSPRPHVQSLPPAPAEAEAGRPEADSGESSDLIAACEAECEELPIEIADVDSPEATAEPVTQESFEWPEPVAPFEPAGAESAATVDGSIASAWATVAEAEGERWMRDHGSD